MTRPNHRARRRHRQVALATRRRRILVPPHLDHALEAGAQFCGRSAGIRLSGPSRRRSMQLQRGVRSAGRRPPPDLRALYDVYSPEEIGEMRKPRYPCRPSAGPYQNGRRSPLRSVPAYDAGRRRLTDTRIPARWMRPDLAPCSPRWMSATPDFIAIRSVIFLGRFQPDIAAREKRLTDIAPRW